MWLKEIYLALAFELIIEAAITIAKLLCFNPGHPVFFRIFNVLDFLTIIIWKLNETNWEYGLYWVILSFFLPLSKEVDYSAEGKFISSKVSYKCSPTYFIN